MNVISTSLPEVLIIEPKTFGDARGFFMESYNQKLFSDAIGRNVNFAQDNHSRSARHVLRGLHYQLVKPQGKLLRCAAGEIFDVAVDLRRGSPHFGKWAGVALSAENNRQLWVPEGFAHGFVVLSESADVLYKTTDYWHPEHERSIRWDDADLAIQWPTGLAPVLSAKDAAATSFKAAEVYA